MDTASTIFVLVWLTTGVAGGQMLSYPGDGLNSLNMSHLLGAMMGPVALLLGLIELSERAE